MKTVTTNDPNKTNVPLELSTILERVQRIKASWSTQTASQRAAEGKRRRAELERMLLGDQVSLKQSKCDFTLVG